MTGDPAVIDQIFADDFLGVAPDGAHYTKQEFNRDTVRWRGRVALDMDNSDRPRTQNTRAQGE